MGSIPLEQPIYKKLKSVYSDQQTKLKKCWLSINNKDSLLKCDPDLKDSDNKVLIPNEKDISKPSPSKDSTNVEVTVQNNSQLFQCYSCHQNFTDKASCVEHIQKDHQQPIQSIDVLGNFIASENILPAVPIVTLCNDALATAPLTIPIVTPPNIIQIQEPTTDPSSTLKHVFQAVMVPQTPSILIAKTPCKLSVPFSYPSIEENNIKREENNQDNHEEGKISFYQMI